MRPLLRMQCDQISNIEALETSQRKPKQNAIQMHCDRYRSMASNRFGLCVRWCAHKMGKVRGNNGFWLWLNQYTNWITLATFSLPLCLFHTHTWPMNTIHVISYFSICTSTKPLHPLPLSLILSHGLSYADKLATDKEAKRRAKARYCPVIRRFDRLLSFIDIMMFV